MSILNRGRFAARLASGDADLGHALALRRLCFRADARPDGDRFDARCRHVLVEETATGTLVCCFRLLPLTGARLGESYAAQFYDLRALAGFEGAMAELGRFCIHPRWHDADILRVAWGAMTRIVDGEGVEMLFGCSSFRGTDPAPYRDSFDVLAARHLAPPRWRPEIGAAEVVRFAPHSAAPDLGRATRKMPPLLRTYLVMGGWVSDHAVVDRELETLHVFTGLEIGKVPPTRARLLRAVAG
ncbi:GNAT family N-acetyltransferase [Oceaniglobus roseus]|uniref:GNAT family N-acetyltransferase n=1 Tax=Oceaniglobus roseus TaxID=1737570 RepID=UPI000C7ED056|nr:GNAT family N-acyltransferase [Kandeliimicrobium roseum]